MFFNMVVYRVLHQGRLLNFSQLCSEILLLWTLFGLEKISLSLSIIYENR